MTNDLAALALAAWLAAALLSLAARGLRAAAGLIALGAAALIAAAIVSLPDGGSAARVPLGIGGADFRLDPAPLWLMGFGLPAAGLAALIGPRRPWWLFGLAASLIGALGVFGLQDAASFLIAWEVMSLGGAVMLLGERPRSAGQSARPVLFMLGLLEVGAVALLLALVILSLYADDLRFDAFARQAASLGGVTGFLLAVLLAVGFGAKLGLLPFYEWFPSAYRMGSGATGAVFSGVILNAALFGLGRGVLQWLPANEVLAVSPAGVFLVAVGVVSAILTALYAFQQEGWRELLSLSSAENGSIAVALVGAALMFRHDALVDLAGLAWAVALIHLAGHALAKGAMFLAAEGVRQATGSYAIAQRGVLARSPVVFGLGALFAAMSLAAMPPQAGFVSEWYVFQTFFQGFRLESLGSRMVAALAGAGFALSAAVAFATFVKVFGVGLLGRNPTPGRTVGRGVCAGVGGLGALVLALAAGLPLWLHGLTGAVTMFLPTDAVQRMHEGWLLVPLTSSFAFISPSKLVIVMPLLALLPMLLLFRARPARAREVPVWFGGGHAAPRRAATTALSFSNALRTFYGFIYRPSATTEREAAAGANGQPYFVHRLVFSHDVAPVFGPHLFRPFEALVDAASRRVRVIQSGRLNIYLAWIALLLVLVLAVSLV